MRKIKYLLYVLFIFFLSFNIVNAEEFTTESFCTGKTQGVFTTIGWIFFILKILIPIIIIIMGSIDFFKAVIASKDKEIKKSMQVLIKRIIAGIIIFLVPTILSFIVKLIDRESIYDENSGTFAKCTYCMLHPNECKGLGD